MARTAKKPKVAAYLKANREGKLEPEGGRNHRPISREGHGLAMAGLSLLPRAPLPATAYYLIEKSYLEGMVASFLIIPNLIRVDEEFQPIFAPGAGRPASRRDPFSFMMMVRPGFQLTLPELPEVFSRADG